MTIATMVVLAARGRLIQKLIEGDPVAWGITGVAVVVVVGIAVWKKKKGGQ
jgi:hypothetical protein